MLKKLLTKIKNLLWGENTYTLVWTLVFISLYFAFVTNKSYERLDNEFYNYRAEVHEMLKDNTELTNKLKQYEQDVYENKIDGYDSFVNSRGY